MSTTDRVAVITGASRGIGAGLVAGFRREHYAVVGNALSIPQSDEPGFVTVEVTSHRPTPPSASSTRRSTASDGSTA